MLKNYEHKLHRHAEVLSEYITGQEDNMSQFAFYYIYGLGFF